MPYHLHNTCISLLSHMGSTLLGETHIRPGSPGVSDVIELSIFGGTELGAYDKVKPDTVLVGVGLAVEAMMFDVVMGGGEEVCPEGPPPAEIATGAAGELGGDSSTLADRL